jgi:hypothetical protein
MNPVDLLLRTEAAQTGRVRVRRRYRHVHVEPAPLAIVAVQMAGEPHGLWAALVGSGPDPTRASLILAPEPRNYDIEFAALAELGSLVCGAVDRCAAGPREPIQRKGKPPRSRLASAPQVLVASSAAGDYLGRLGRRMRPAGRGGKRVVPPAVNLGGAHLGFFAEAADEPGSSLLLVAARELSRHFATGQSDLEDAHLGAQLAWHDPRLLAEVAPGLVTGAAASKLHGADAAELIEHVPMGVLTDPEADSAKLRDLVTAFNRRRGKRTDPATVAAIASELGFADHLRPALLPIWRATWIAHRILLALPHAPGVVERWTNDRDRFTYHVKYVEEGGRFASVPSIRRTTRQLGTREKALETLTCSEVLEDPLAMAAALAQGQAVRGKVVEVDTDHHEVSRSNRRTSRPLVTLALDGDCPFPAGAELHWSARPAVAAEVHDVTLTRAGGARVVLKVTAGMRGALPEVGDVAIFSIFAPAWMPEAPMPAKTPWTHEPAPDAPGHDSLEIDDGPPLDELIGLAAMPEMETV